MRGDERVCLPFITCNQNEKDGTKRLNIIENLNFKCNASRSRIQRGEG